MSIIKDLENGFVNPNQLVEQQQIYQKEICDIPDLGIDLRIERQITKLQKISDELWL